MRIGLYLLFCQKVITKTTSLLFVCLCLGIATSSSCGYFVFSSACIHIATTFYMRTPNSYILFCQDNRETVATANPGSSNGDVSSILGSMRRELDDDQKEIYIARSAELKEVCVIFAFIITLLVNTQTANETKQIPTLPGTTSGRPIQIQF